MTLNELLTVVDVLACVYAAGAVSMPSCVRCRSFKRFEVVGMSLFDFSIEELVLSQLQPHFS